MCSCTLKAQSQQTEIHYNSDKKEGFAPGIEFLQHKGAGPGCSLFIIELFSFKGAVHQIFNSCLNLIFWIVMGVV